MYAGLNVFPNSDTFDQAELAIQSKNRGSNMCKQKCPSAQHKLKFLSDVPDMEVFISRPGNKFLENCLDCIRRNIGAMNLPAAGNIFRRQYISETTGEQCIKKFLVLKENAEVLRTTEVLELSHFF